MSVAAFMAQPPRPATCPFCKSTDIITDYSAGDEICRSCAAVITERLVCTEAEWRDYDNDDRGGRDQARCGGATNTGDALQESVILGGNSTLRKSLTRAYMSSSIGGIDIKLADNTAQIHELSAKLDLSESVSVRFSFSPVNCT